MTETVSFWCLDLGSLRSVKLLQVSTLTFLVYSDMAASLRIMTLPPHIQKLELTGCKQRTEQNPNCQVILA
jgi:hypothetical protein